MAIRLTIVDFLSQQAHTEDISGGKPADAV